MDETTSQIVIEAEKFLAVKRSEKLSRKQVHDLFARLNANKKLASSFLVCLVARLISLNSVHAYKELSAVVDELLGLFRFTDADGYKKWVGKAPSPLSESVEEIVGPLRWMQGGVLHTVYYLVCFVECERTDNLEAIWREWNVAVASTCDDVSASAVDELEQRVMDRVAMVMQDGVDSDVGKRVRQATQGFSVGQLINCHGESVRSQPVCDPFLYYELLWSTGKRDCADTVVEMIVNQLGGEQLEFDEKKENLFPLLQMFLEVASTAWYIDPNRYFDAYRAIQPYYLWPQPYCAFVRDTLDFVRVETRCPGYHSRKRMINENEGLKFLNETLREQQIHVFVDRACSEASALLTALKCLPVRDVQLKKMFIRRLFYSFFGPAAEDLAEVERHLEAIKSESFLDHLCTQAAIASEEAIQQQSEEIARDTLIKHLHSIMETIRQHASEDDLSPPPSPSPPPSLPPITPTSFKCHAFDSQQVSSPLEIVHAMLGNRFGLKNPSFFSKSESAEISERMSSQTSQTSMDSTGSSPLIMDNGSNDTNHLPSRNNSLVSCMTIDSTGSTAVAAHSLDSFSPVSKPSRSESEPFGPGQFRVRQLLRTPSLPAEILNLRQGGGKDLDSLRLRSPKMARHDGFSARRKPSLNVSEVLKPLLLKLVILGDDRSVKSVAESYAILRKTYPALMQEMEIRFYYIPVIQGKLWSSERVWLARFLNHFDGWYGHKIISAVTDVQKILPMVSEAEDDWVESNCLVTPQTLLQGVITHFCSHAHYELFIRLYEVKISHCEESTTAALSMLQRIEVLPAGQQQQSREFTETTTKPQNLFLNASLVTVDGHVHETIMITDKLFWSITLSNLLRPGDSCIANPEVTGFELTLIEAATVQQMLRTTKYVPKDETKEVLHINEVIISTPELQVPFRIVIDDGDPIEVQRLEVRPLVCSAIRRPSVILPAMPTSPSDDGNREELSFRLMTYWPMTL